MYGLAFIDEYDGVKSGASLNVYNLSVELYDGILDTIIDPIYFSFYV
jgi:hypothetical protein